jgi:hypothetical protein
VKCSNSLEICKLDERLKLENLGTKIAYLVKNDTIDDKFDGANSCIMQPSKINSKVVQITSFCLPWGGEGGQVPQFFIHYATFQKL